MIIVSQDRKTIVNFDRTTEIVVNSNEVCITDDIYIEYAETIGTYATKEKAKEVLKEIIKVYKFNKGKGYTIGDRQKLLGDYEYGVYEMPEE